MTLDFQIRVSICIQYSVSAFSVQCTNPPYQFLTFSDYSIRVNNNLSWVREFDKW